MKRDRFDLSPDSAVVLLTAFLPLAAVTGDEVTVENHAAWLAATATAPAGAVAWVIVGGESGHGARPIQREWADSLRRECEAAGVAFFFKQWGGPSATAGGCDLDGHEVKQWPQTA